MPSPHAAVAAGPKHEVADVSGRRILWTAAGLAAMLVVVALAAWAVLGLVGSGRPDVSSRRDAVSSMPAPRLQSAPSSDLRALREEKRAMLTEYRWLDRDAGVVQIPIARAMELLVARSEQHSRPNDAASGTKR